MSLFILIKLRIYSGTSIVVVIVSNMSLLELPVIEVVLELMDGKFNSEMTVSILSIVFCTCYGV